MLSGQPAVHVRERCVIENPRRGIAHFFHREADAAAIFVGALAALHVGGLADARHGGQRPFEDADDLTERDFVGFAAEEVAPALAFLAVDEAVALELEQDRLEEFLGDGVAARQVRHEDGTATLFAREGEKRLEAVFGLPRQHGS